MSWSWLGGGGGCGWRNQTIHVAVASVISLVENYKKKRTIIFNEKYDSKKKKKSKIRPKTERELK